MSDFYHQSSRELQDRFDTRRLADRIEQRLLVDRIGDADKAFIESQFGPSTDWKYSAEKRKEEWTVKMEYVGPQPVSIMQPPVYEIDLDEREMFHDLRRY